MKRTASLILCLVLLASLLVACADPQPAVHTHEFASEWSKNAYGHWHAATCDHNVQSELAAHVGTEEDGTCDICGYVEHDHTYAEAWSSNAWGHWLEATCECDARKDAAAHVDENLDGACDICAYDADHIHGYATEWTADETGHWHASACGHNVKADFAAHTANDAGYCTVCGVKVAEVTIETIADAIAAAQAQANLIVSGSILDYENIYGTDITTTVSYAFGDGYTYISEPDPWGNMNEYYYSPVGEDGVFCVMVVNGEKVEKNNMAISVDNLKGYQFDCDFINYYGNYYGAEDLLAGLYELATENANGDKAEEILDGVYSFSFGYYYSEYYLNVVNVAFTLADDYTLESLVITSERYTSGNYTANGDGTATVNDGAVADYNYSIAVAQEVASDGKNPYAPENMLATDFTLTDAEGNVIGDTVNVTAGTPLYLYINNIAPATAYLTLDTFTMEYSEEDVMYAMYTSYDWINTVAVDRIQISGYEKGTYTLTIKTAYVTKTLTVNVTMPDPTYIGASVWGTNDWGYEDFTTKTAVTMYTGNVLKFTAEVNEYADGSFTAQLTGDNAANATLTEGTVTDMMGKETAVTVFTPSAAGVYTVTITSAVVEGISVDLVITVEEAPNVAEILNGDYIYSDNWNGNINVTFTPSAEGATDGTVTITNPDGTETMTYTYADGTLTATHAEGAELGYTVSLTDSFGVKLTADGWWGPEDYILKRVTAEVMVNGYWSDAVNGYTLSMTYDDYGIYGSFSTMNSSTVAFTYTMEKGEDGNYYFTFTLNEASCYMPEEAMGLFNFAEGSYMTADFSQIVLVMADGSTVTFTK